MLAIEKNSEKSDWKPIDNLDKHCFACGPDNQHGLHMTFETNGEKLRSCICVPEHLRGWHNLVHGGIISTIIDEAMSWAAIHLHNRFILTKSMQVQFKKPVIIEKYICVYGYVLERINDRQVRMQADIINEKGDVCASGTGEFVLFTKEQFSDLNIMDTALIDKMAEGVAESAGVSE